MWNKIEQLALQKAYLGHSWLCYSRSRRFTGLYVGSARWSPGSFPCEVAAGCLVSSQLVKACLEWALLSFTVRPLNWVVSLLIAGPLLTLPGRLSPLSDVLCQVMWHFGHPVLLTSVVLDSLFPPSLLPPTLSSTHLAPHWQALSPVWPLTIDVIFQNSYFTPICIHFPFVNCWSWEIILLPSIVSLLSDGSWEVLTTDNVLLKISVLVIFICPAWDAIPPGYWMHWDERQC